MTKQKAESREQISTKPFLNKKTLFLLSALCSLLSDAGGAVADGYVVRVDSTTIYLDWGKASGVQQGDRFTIYRAGETLKHPVSGAVLGRTETTVASGSIRSLEDKFSIGQLETMPLAPRAGDRARRVTSSVDILAPIPSTGAAKPQEALLVPAALTLAELWRSEPLEKDATSIAFADLDGDGRKDLVAAYRKKIVAYRLKDRRLEPMATFEHRTYGHWLGIDAADVKGDGHQEIFATAFLEGLNRPRVVVLRFENGALKKVAELEGFARAMERADGTKRMYWQTFSRSTNDVRYSAVSELRWEKEKYQPGPPLDLKLSNGQLFGIAWGNWTKSADENLAVLERGERIRIYSKDAKWKSSGVFGGTKNDFSFDGNAMGTLFPRLINYRSQTGGQDQLLVPTNFPELGVRLTYLKVYRKSELVALTWNGFEMKPAWRLAIAGYLADYGIADMLAEGRSQLWIAVVGPGDKTVLQAYSLP